MPRKMDDPWGRAEILLGAMSKMDGTDSRERARGRHIYMRAMP
jgi:hypothetical protein